MQPNHHPAIWPATLLLSVVLLGGTESSGAPLDPDIQNALHAAFEAPGASWSAVHQGFWPNVRVFKLKSVADRRWYHRPTVAIDASGRAHVVTDGIFAVPPTAPLFEFNAISRSEHVVVDARNVSDFAGFFLRSYLLYSDATCLSSSLPAIPEAGELPSTLCSEPPPFRLSTQGSLFVVDTVVVDRSSRDAQAWRFTIDRDGQISR